MLAGELIIGGFAGQGALGSHAKDPWERFTGELDRLHCEFRKGETIYRVTAELFEAAATVLSAGGEKIAERLERAASHPISEFVYQCPFTRHAFEKPRGYAGDAELMDYITATPRRIRLWRGRLGLVGPSSSRSSTAQRRRPSGRAQYHCWHDRRHGQPGRPGPDSSVACGNARELELVIRPLSAKSKSSSASIGARSASAPPPGTGSGSGR